MKKIAIYIFMILIIFNTSFQRLGLPFISSIDEAFVLGSVLYGVLFSKGKFSKLSLYLLLWIISFFCIGLFSYYDNSYDQIYSRFSLLGGLLSIKFPLIIFAFMNIKLKDETVKSWLNCVLNIAKVTSPFVIASFLIPDVYATIFPFVSYETPRLGFHGAMGLFYFPGLSGWFYFYIACFYLSSFQYKNSKRDFLSFLYFSAIALLSLKAKVIMSVAIIVFLWAVFFSKKYKALKISFGILTGISLIASFSSVLKKNISMYILGNSSMQEDSARLALLKASNRIATDYFPFGVGFSKFASEYAKRNYSEYYYIYGINNIYGLRIAENAGFSTDTYWPQIIGETGYLGLVPVVIQYVFLFKNLLSRVNSKIVADDQKKYILFSLFVFIQALLESSAAAIFNTPPQYLLIGIIVGYSLSNNIRINRIEN